MEAEKVIFLYNEGAQKDPQSGEKRGFSELYFRYMTEPKVPIFAAIRDFFSVL